MVGEAIKGEQVSRSGRGGPIPERLDKKFEVHVERVVELLNEALRIDKHAISDLVSERITVNKDLALHPTIQCVETGRGRYEMGLLGFLNGLFGVDEEKHGAIKAVIDPRTNLVASFEVCEPWKGEIGPTAA